MISKWFMLVLPFSTKVQQTSVGSKLSLLTCLSSGFTETTQLIHDIRSVVLKLNTQFRVQLAGSVFFFCVHSDWWSYCSMKLNTTLMGKICLEDSMMDREMKTLSRCQRLAHHTNHAVILSEPAQNPPMMLLAWVLRLAEHYRKLLQ